MHHAARRVLAGAFAPLAIALCLPAPAAAQLPSCGGYSVGYWIRPDGSCALRVEWVSRTTRPFDLCSLEVQAEGYIKGTGGTQKDRDRYVAEVHAYQPVPSAGTWHLTTKHWLIWNGGLTWTYLGTNSASTSVTACQASCDLNQLSCPDGTEFQPWRCDCVTLSPILIDTAGDGYRLSSADEGTIFDLDADGAAREKVAWPAPESDDGWLVMDRNGNGMIDSGAELFGSKTPAYADAADPPALNGFVALSFTEDPGYGTAAADGIIDARDAVFSRLRLWFDRNRNGISEGDELVPLAEAGIVSISTVYTETNHRDRFGNRFSLKGRAVFRDAAGREHQRNIYDVYLTVAGAPSR
jgi:hypothetical protein